MLVYRLCLLIVLGSCSCSLLFDPLDAAVDAAVGEDSFPDGSDSSPDGGDSSPDGGDVDVPDGDFDVPDGDFESVEVDETACDDLLAGAILCDGFEGSLLEVWDRVAGRGGDATIREEVVHRGLGALRVESFRQGGGADLYGGIDSIFSGDLYARLYLFLPGGVELKGFTFFWVGEPVEPYDHLGVQVSSGGVLGLWVNESASWFQSSDSLPRDRWFCVQLHVSVSHTAGAVELSVDGAPFITETAIDSAPESGISGISLGLQYPLEQDPITFYVDEFALGTAPLPCDP